MFVYRIEHKTERIGPYTDTEDGYGIGYEFRDEIAVGEEHPAPWEDGLDHCTYAYYCGFSSKAQMQAWFKPHHIEWFEKNDYYVYRYVVNPQYVEHGCKQCMFKRDCALIRFKTTYH